MAWVTYFKTKIALHEQTLKTGVTPTIYKRLTYENINRSFRELGPQIEHKPQNLIEIVFHRSCTLLNKATMTLIYL